MQLPSVYLASILLEKNRWANKSHPSLLASSWLQPALTAGFAGIELWEFHWSHATPDEQERLRRQQGVAVYNCYANLRVDDLGRRSAAIHAASALGAKAIKFNFGPDPRFLNEEIRALSDWAANLPPGMQLWCECHSASLAETPAGGKRIAAELDPANVGFISHAFSEQTHCLAQWLDALGPRLVHVHVQSRNRSGQWLALSEQSNHSAAALDQLARAGFTGSYSIEFTAGVNTPSETPSALFAAACEDLRFIMSHGLALSPN